MTTARQAPNPALPSDTAPPIPWEDGPAGSNSVLWRSSRNPIIARDLLPRSNSAPQLPYEQVGDVQNVVFPCAALVDRAADRLTVYYGGADTVVCIAHGFLSEVIEFVLSRS